MKDVINEEKISISKQEYEELKNYEKESIDFEVWDFMLEITSGLAIPKDNSNYYNDITKIKIISQENYSIFIEGQEYAIKSTQLFNKIKAYVSENLNALINWSMRQTKLNLADNLYEGGGSTIRVKFGNLFILVQGNVFDIGKLCEHFIEEIKQLIITEGYKIQEEKANNDKFIWNNGDIKIAKTLCEFCKYNNKEQPNICAKYHNGKPSEVINNTIKCSKFDNKNGIL